MRIEKRVEKELSRAEKAFLSNEEAQTALPSSGWRTILSRKPTETGSETANFRQNRLMNEALTQFYSDLRNCLPLDYKPFSILPCILALPENICDWPSPEVFFRVFTSLLADQGFLFYETLESASGQYSSQDLVAALDKTAGIRAQREVSETELIGRIEQLFFSRYCRPEDNRQSNGPPTVLRQLERIVAPCHANLFHACLERIIDVYNRKASVMWWADNHYDLAALCQEEFGLTAEQLDTHINADGAVLKAASADSCSLRDALTVLSEICSYQMENADETLGRFRSLTKLSRDSYTRYCEFIRVREDLTRELQDNIPFFLCSSRYLPEYHKQNLKDWYQHVDGIKTEMLQQQRKYRDIPAGQPIVQAQNQIDNKVRINGQTTPGTKGELPEYLRFSWFARELEDIAQPQLDKIRHELRSIFYKYRKQFGSQRVKTDMDVVPVIDAVIALSLMEMFSPFDNDSSVAIAPVIAYLAFTRWLFVLPNKESPTQISTHIFTTWMKPDWKNIDRDLALYVKLRKVYAKYYGALYTKQIQAVWDAAFLTFTGYRQLYQLPGSVQTMDKFRTMLHPSCWDRVGKCLQANRVSLVHTAVARMNWKNLRDRRERFRPYTPDDPGWNAVSCFRQMPQLEMQLEKFRRFLIKPHSHDDIYWFIVDCLRELVLSDTGGDSTDTYQTLYSELGLEAVFSGSDSNSDHKQRPDLEAELGIVLEHTMRLMLEEQCCQRLYKWLSDWIDCEVEGSEVVCLKSSGVTV